MSDDELAIRSLVETWLAASQRGDIPKVLSLIADDVVFMVPGQEPFGKDEFASRSDAMKAYVSSILRKKPDGAWVIARDANLLTAQESR